MHTAPSTVLRFALTAALALVVTGFPASNYAAIPYNKPLPNLLPLPGAGIPTPVQVPGKQYSHRLDQAIDGVADPAQIISWDGLGGTIDDADFSLPAPPYSTSGNFQIDSLANERDSLFNFIIDERAHLVYSVDTRAITTAAFGGVPFTVPSAGPVTLYDAIKGGSNIIGGAGEISYELGTSSGRQAANKHGLWASQTQVNGMPVPVHIDGLELWGPEPGPNNVLDAGKYSVATDASTATANQAYSVWTYQNTGHTGYVPQAMIVSLVQNLLQTAGLTSQNVDLDGLMVMDDHDSPNTFDAGDRIIFSIRQVPTLAAPGFLATGSELFLLNGNGTGSFLFHGGHFWDKTYAMANMVARFPAAGGSVDVQLDMSDIEAIALAPEPTSAVLGLLGCIVASAVRTRRARNVG